MRRRLALASATLIAPVGLAGPAAAQPQRGLVNAAVIAEQVVRTDKPLVGECVARNDAPFEITT
ncbi:MAG: hypothetical protein L0I24_15100 [Pseudonocardia sp.]|nr:hypothetical protein [Pseudonocardia sp.]